MCVVIIVDLFGVAIQRSELLLLLFFVLHVYFGKINKVFILSGSKFFVAFLRQYPLPFCLLNCVPRIGTDNNYYDHAILTCSERRKKSCHFSIKETT